ncbi:phosphoglucomutase, cytoplasmic-like [Glycine soja]|uniref:phosphoglucomutase, cytoplasmic-like n=1 Tax=Glycine soja TaxID=3848 RepID=UPI0010387FA5|nr:phosphoglucomutase, cytoplasmic-like [Glycine soja]
MRWSILWSIVCFCGDWSTCCDLVNIDTVGITALEELHKSLSSHGKQNVDAGAAKELMAYLVKLQSSLSEVNQYVNFSTLTIEAIWFTQLRKES